MSAPYDEAGELRTSTNASFSPFDLLSIRNLFRT